MTAALAGSRRPTPEEVHAHVEYLKELRLEKKVLAAGPLETGGRRLRIYRASGLAEAESLVARDPYVAAGLINYELDAWRLHDSFSAPLIEVLGRQTAAIVRDRDEYPGSVANA